MEEVIFFFFCVSPNFFFRRSFLFATIFNPSNNKASLTSSQFYVTRYHKWTFSVPLITLLIVIFLFLRPFTITAINIFLEGSDFHFHHIRKQWLQATGKNRTYLPDVGHHTNIAVVATKLAFRQKLFHYLVVYHGLYIRYAVINTACFELSESKLACIIFKLNKFKKDAWGWSSP